MKDTSGIPHGIYCYEFLGVEYDKDKTKPPKIKTRRCPYLSFNPDKHDQDNGFCQFLNRGDWDGTGFGMLWDSVKECGINDEDS